MVTRSNEIDKYRMRLVARVEELAERVLRAVRDGEEVHRVERMLFASLLALGFELMRLFFAAHGDGDLGETVDLPDGRRLRRLPEPGTRAYVTVFGEFELTRRVYGTRPRQRIELVPLDARLNLPEGKTSYMLQDWNQELGVQDAWRHVSRWFDRTFDVNLPVDTLERTNRRMAENVAGFRDALPPPDQAEEGAILVVTADHKGVPMRRPAADRPTGARRRRGEKANKKRMACLGAVYTVDPKRRTPEEVLASLFREPPPRPPGDCPRACGKRVHAALSRGAGEGPTTAREEVFAWLAEEVARRRQPGQTLARVMDGERSLADEANERLPDDGETIDVLDLLHAIERLWSIAYLFHAEGSPEATAWVRPRLLEILRGNVGRVVGGIRQSATKQGMSAAKRTKLERHCRYLASNAHRMRYDEYLAAGLPVASGVIEGACRHVVRDRMELAGMRWTERGARAMLELRTTWINGQWESFQEHHIAHERERLHPYQAVAQPIAA